MTARDWSKERWRKQFVREPLQHRTWPVMARGLRELLNALAEDDGTLIGNAADPTAALIQALGTHDSERELVRAALDLLLESGIVERTERSLRLRDFVEAQARPAERFERETPAEAERPRSSSAERVRRFRERQREQRRAADAGHAPGVTGSVSDSVVAVTADVSPSGFSVSAGATASRGNSNQDALDNSLREKEEINQIDLQSSARPRESVTAVTSGAAPGASPQRVSRQTVSSTKPRTPSHGASGRRDDVRRTQPRDLPLSTIGTLAAEWLAERRATGS